MLEPTEVWTKGRELSILTFTALSKVTSENGGVGLYVSHGLATVANLDLLILSARPSSSLALT